MRSIFVFFKCSVVITFTLLIGMGNAYAAGNWTENWTGEIKWVNVLEDGSAYIFIDNPREGPGSSFPCSANIVHLGTKNLEVNKSLLSVALTVYAAQKFIRFGIRGTGDSCEVGYISAR